MTAIQTPTIQLLTAHWESVAKSPELNHSVRQWTSSHPELLDKATTEIIELVARPCWSYVKVRDEVLRCLLHHRSDALSQRVVLQSLLPQVIHITDRLGTGDPDEMAAYVVSVASEQIARFSRPDVVCIHWWLYRSIKRQVERTTLSFRYRRREEYCLGQSGEYDAQPDLCQRTGSVDGGDMDQLIDLISERGGIDRRSAEIIVLTRTDTVSVSAMSQALGMEPDTLRKQRLRAESKLRQKLSLADFV